MLCLKKIPARAVTSTNSIGPEGLAASARAGKRLLLVGVADDEGDASLDALLALDELWLAFSEVLCLQPAINDASSKSEKR